MHECVKKFYFKFLKLKCNWLTIFVLISGVQHSDDHNKSSCHLSPYKILQYYWLYSLWCTLHYSVIYFFCNWNFYLLISLTYFAHLPILAFPPTTSLFSVSMRKKHTEPQTVAFLAQIPSWTFAFLGEDTLISHSYPALGTTVSGCLRSCVIRYYCHTNPSLASPHKLSFLDPPCSLYRQWF